MSLSKTELKARDRERKRQRYAKDPAFKAARKAAAERWRQRNPDRVKALARAAAARWRARNPDQHKATQLRGKYGLPLAEYKAMLQKANGRCAVCAAKKPLVVDHCHVTGKVRGLLCHGCNVGLGLLGDSVAGLTRAVGYLQVLEDHGVD